MVSTEKIVELNSATYAVAKDFCRIFEQDMDRLYLLSLLLTGDHTKAEQCYAGGLEDSSRSQRVFKEWARSWARRMVVQNAIQMIRPTTARSDAMSQRADHAEPPEISAVLDLPVFDRFVFVMSVLERYSDQDCALLLGSTRAEVVAARVRALQGIARSADTYRATKDPREPLAPEVALALRIESVPLLATLP